MNKQIICSKFQKISNRKISLSKNCNSRSKSDVCEKCSIPVKEIFIFRIDIGKGIHCPDCVINNALAKILIKNEENNQKKHQGGIKQ